MKMPLIVNSESQYNIQRAYLANLQLSPSWEGEKVGN